MRLPTNPRQQVQKLGRNKPGGVAALASATADQGRSEQRLFNQMAGLAAEFIQRKENSEFNDQVTDTHIEIKEFKQAHSAKTFYTAEEAKGTSAATVKSTTDDYGVAIEHPNNNIPAYEVYPEMLAQKQAGMIKEKAAKITNPFLREEYVRKAEVIAAQNNLEAGVNAERQQQAYTLAEGIAKSQAAADAQDIAAGLWQIDNLETSELHKKELRDDVYYRAEFSGAAEASHSSNPETVQAWLNTLQAEDYDGALPLSQRNGFISSFNAQLKNLDAERLAALAKQHEVAYSDAQAAIDSGNYTYAQIEKGFDRYRKDENDPTAWDGAERTALRGRMDAFNAGRDKFNNSAALGESLMFGTADPYDPDHQKAIDAMVEKEGSAGDMRRQEQIAMQTSILSEPAENYLNSSALNMPAADAIPALQMYGRLTDSDPYKVREMGPEAKEIFSDAHILARGGVEPVMAMEIARENARLAPEVKEQRERDYRELKATKEKNPTALRDFMDADEGVHGFDPTFWGSSPAATDAMAGEFQNMTAYHYNRTGDLARAQQMAWSSIKETWGPTRVGAMNKADGPLNGENRAMKLSPERVMNVSTERANAALGAFAEGHGFDVDRLMVITDPQTQRDGSWQIMVIDPETNMPVVPINDVDNSVIRWKGSEWLQYGDEYAYSKKVKAEVEKRDAALKKQAEVDDLYSGVKHGAVMGQ